MSRNVDVIKKLQNEVYRIQCLLKKEGIDGDPKLEFFGDLFTITDVNQTDYTLSAAPTVPEAVVVEYDNHVLMYGIGYTIVDNKLSLIIGSDWNLELGEPLHVKYYKQDF